jgi:hypothetical protein
VTTFTASTILSLTAFLNLLFIFLLSFLSHFHDDSPPRRLIHLDRPPNRAKQKLWVGDFRNGGLIRHLVSGNVKHVIITRRRRSLKSRRHKSSSPHRYPRTFLHHPLLIIIAVITLLSSFCSASTPGHYGLSIWTLNVSSGQTVYKMNTIHSQIMQQTPDIFVLTDTQHSVPQRYSIEGCSD